MFFVSFLSFHRFPVAGSACRFFVLPCSLITASPGRPPAAFPAFMGFIVTAFPRPSFRPKAGPFTKDRP